MANRLLLTLLALLTGLAAQIGPADARASQVASLQVVLTEAAVAAKAPRAPVALAQLPEPGFRSVRRQAPPLVETPDSLAIPAVLTGIDRARE
ncbi:hypothetical protein [Novosphingobium lindaniclasticum]|uniref:Uncharacterized protein n=1 Tax=Novosphingobium lindaniclasticum LE124 TaxID=1096930 RepID=T0HCV0_9SPHN|nr:hypothetical protein [Novosphingobium lindaniclasticum]EQB09958.1 hypothetical protein L284_18275 [Novosphingobium lindaniclasticum LE124]